MKHGCNGPRHVEPKYLAQDGYLVRFDPDVGAYLKLPKYVEVWTADSAVLCRNDRRKEDPMCAGCPSPWDVQYLKQQGLL